jgi:hypothetical protein
MHTALGEGAVLNVVLPGEHINSKRTVLTGEARARGSKSGGVRFPRRHNDAPLSLPLTQLFLNFATFHGQ